MRQWNFKPLFFVCLLTSFLVSGCGQMGLSGLLGGSTLMGAAGDSVEPAGDDWVDEGNIDLDDEDGSGANYDASDFSGAGDSAGAAYYYSDDAEGDDGLVPDDESDNLMGTGSLSPENMPVTMSKLFPEDGDCNEDTEGSAVGVMTDDGDGSAYMMPPPEDESSHDSHARRASRRYVTFRFTPSRMNARFTESAYQCQYTGTDPETGEELYEWVEVDIEEFLDLIDAAGLSLGFRPGK